MILELIFVIVILYVLYVQHRMLNASGQDSSNEIDESRTLYSINVKIRSTDTICTVEMNGNATIGELIAAVCQKINIDATPDHYYLTCSAHELNVNDTIRESGLLDAIDSTGQTWAELRLKFVHQLEESTHLGTHVVFASPEQLAYHEMLKVPFSPTQEEIMPGILQPLAKQTFNHASQLSAFSSKLISMPVFTKQVIDELPSVHITVPLKPNEFDWNAFLQCLAIDLEIERSDMFLMSVQEGSTKYEIKFKANISFCKKKMKKIAAKLCVLVLPTSKSAQFIAKQKSSSDTRECPTIEAQLHNFSEGKDLTASETSLTPDEIDAFLTLVQRPAIIDLPAWQFLTEKSRKLSSCILHAFQTSPIEYVIENLSLVYNEELYHRYHQCSVHGEEKILFHGTQKITNLDGIFEQNFKNLHTTDAGWYGRGIYFSSSPKYCACYVEWSLKGVTYLICSLIKLGKVYPVKDKSYDGKEMRADSDSHYVKVTADGYPTNAEHSFFEEFVIKRSDQILPLYIIGLRPVHRFVLWRDAKITNSHNGTLFAQMKGRYNFNIYASETSAEGLAILQCKLADAVMECIVVTNGADNGEEFSRECRNIRSSLLIIVYCTKIDYHKQWATKMGGHPEIQVTGDSNDVFNLINSTFPQTTS